MKRIMTFLAAAALFSGCRDAADQGLLGSLTPAFQSIPLAFDNPEQSFATPPNGEVPLWGPVGFSQRSSGLDKGGTGGGDMHRGKGLPFIMGGGLGDLFIGGGFGIKFGKVRYGNPVLYGNCPFDASTGRVICDPVLRSGLTIKRSAAFSDANGTVQGAFDSTSTDAINVRIAVSGTITRRDNAQSTVDHASDRTVSGLAPGSTQRKVNGSAAGTENTSGTKEGKQFTAVRVVGDTITNVIVPVPASPDQRTYPMSGSVVRAMQVTLTFNGESPVSSSRREVITYDGTNTARVVITHDGVTKNCTLPLPKGRLSCE